MRPYMRRPIVTVAAVAAIAAIAVPADAATKSIKVGDDYYVKAGPPATVMVGRGDRVVWSFVGRSPHTVNAADGTFRSPPRTSGRFSRRMTRTGTYTIFCAIHGPRKMSMTLVVS
jgi:plastocyanin